MFELAIWKWKARLYKQFRRRPPFRYILQQEQQAFSALLERMEIPVSTVIDLGTGRGQALSNYQDSHSPVGIDQSIEMLAMAREECPYANFICGNAIHLPIRKNMADLVLAIGLLEYVHEPAHVLHEINRILKDRAYALVTISPPSIWTTLRRLYGMRLYPMRIGEFGTFAQTNNFEVCANRHTMMQQQFLIRKI